MSFPRNPSVIVHFLSFPNEIANRSHRLGAGKEHRIRSRPQAGHVFEVWVNLACDQRASAGDELNSSRVDTPPKQSSRPSTVRVANNGPRYWFETRVCSMITGRFQRNVLLISSQHRNHFGLPLPSHPELFIAPCVGLSPPDFNVGSIHPSTHRAVR